MARSLEMQMIVNTFLDKERVLRKWDADKIKGMTRSGALVRFIARRSIRPARRISLAEMSAETRAAFLATQRKARRTGRPGPKRPFKSSPPGKPPFNKQGTLKDGIYFGLEPKTDEMYVGAVAVGGVRTARLLEHGGDAVLKGSDGKQHRMRFRGNPFMKPALDEAAPKIPAMFKDVIKADAVSLTRGPRG